jgi:hypothetical protein
MANDCIPYFEPGQWPSGKCSAAVTGKRFLQITGNRYGGPGLADPPTDQSNLYSVGMPGASGAQGAGKRVIGVAAWDAASGDVVDIIRAGIVPVNSGAAIPAGSEVMTDANGNAVVWTSTNIVVGVCMNATTGANQDAEIALI